MTRIVLETEDGDVVHETETEGMPEAVEWNGRIFLLNEKGADDPVTYTEIEPVLLPYSPVQAGPAEDNGEDEDA